MVDSRTIQIVRYFNSSGKAPFDAWFDSLDDKRTASVVNYRLYRVAQGNFGNCRSLGGGVWELKIDFGPGIRVYFARVGSVVVLLLCAGDKSSQVRDITKAQDYWMDYRRRHLEKKT